MQIILSRPGLLTPALLLATVLWPLATPEAATLPMAATTTETAQTSGSTAAGTPPGSSEAGAPAPLAPAAAAAGPSRYRLRTETSLPNLEENLRYATRQEERCVDPTDLSDQFWMTRDSALTDCQLEKTSQTATAATYRLACRGKHGAEGLARWSFDGARITGVLDLRLGGKNMTVTQRVTGERLGACD